MVGKTLHGTAKKGMDAHGTKRVGRRVRASPKRPPKSLQKMTVFVPAFYAVEHKILKIEHQFYHFRVTKPKMWDNVQSDSFLGHFCLEKRNPCYYTGCPKGARIHHLENLKNRTLINTASLAPLILPPLAGVYFIDAVHVFSRLL